MSKQRTNAFRHYRPILFFIDPPFCHLIGFAALLDIVSEHLYDRIRLSTQAFLNRYDILPTLSDDTLYLGRPSLMKLSPPKTGRRRLSPSKGE